jgi:hypothetical protein
MFHRSKWLAVLGLLVAGGVFVYVQSRRSSPLPEFPSDPPPPAANAAAPAAAARACPQATARSPSTPDIFFPRLTLGAGPAVPRTFPVGPPDPAPPLVAPIGELRAGSIFSELDRAGDDRRLAFVSKRPDEDEPLIFGFNNTSGIGPQFLLLKNEDTSFLGRVAGRYCQAHPGLSDDDRLSEVFLGCQFEHRLSRRDKLFSTVEYACDPADPGSRSLRTQAAWEFLLDPRETLSLRTTVLESSSYAASREQAKNVDYSLNLTWKY